MVLRLTFVAVGGSSRHAAPRLPPIQSTDITPEQYYPQSATAQLNAVFGQEAKPQRPHLSHSLSGQQQPASGAGPPPVPGRGPVPKFQKVESTQDLKPKINTQPAFRRANPEGGFISVSQLLTRSQP